MQPSLEIIYLHHSGFAIKTEKHLLVFDYYQDPANSMTDLLDQGQTTYVFSSHSHGDHFNQEIGKWQKKVAAYFLSDDIIEAGGLKSVDDCKLIYMKPYESKEQADIQVATYGSTDQGLSFLVNVDGWRIFHAGDLNWWHWKQDTPENIKAAQDGFAKELALLAGLKLDVAFFPVDSRLEEFWAIGAEEFCRKVDVKHLVAMHSCGKVWQPAAEFPEPGKQVAVWSPGEGGQSLKVLKSEF
ncbi:hypothetical protein SDC9_09194 [bioreactor metagenome]|uniref:Metallo-beta-lactamase domain-containing protein n=1 Tax=bioreactor metagenome TaxID=1076179 RepID=A0A644T9Q2_9ZZZZ|nr:MBL fold metallo-hydrolase [Negativicutes bacterium]